MSLEDPLSDVLASYKCSRTERPACKSRDSAIAKKAISSRKADGWTPGHSGADAIKFAQSKSGDSGNLRGVFGRRRSNTDRNEY